jgi:hypothetical protein
MNFLKKLFGCKCKKCCFDSSCNCPEKEKCCKEETPVEQAPVEASPAEESNPQM